MTQRNPMNQNPTEKTLEEREKKPSLFWPLAAEAGNQYWHR